MTSNTDDVEPGIVDLLLIFARRWKLLGGLTLVGFLAGAGQAILRTPMFMADSSFLSNSSSGSISPLARVAALGGFAIAPGGDSESPAFYAELLTSRPLLLDLAMGDVPMRIENGDTMWVSASDFFEVDSESETGRIQTTIGRIASTVVARTDPNTGLVRIRTLTPNPITTVWLNHQILRRVIDYNLTRRQSKARSEREFLEERQDSARLALNAAESELEAFLDANRGSSASSPRIQFEEQRLQRHVSNLSQIYSALVQAYEEARIEEVRDTPVMTVVEGPEFSLVPVGRPPLINGILFAFAAGALALMIAFVDAFFRKEQVDRPAQFQELRALLGRSGTGAGDPS